MCAFLKTYIFVISMVVFLGNILSEFNLLGSSVAWSIGIAILVIGSYCICRVRLEDVLSELQWAGISVFREWKTACLVEKWMVFFLVGATFSIAVFSLLGLLLIAPRNGDVLGYHLPRMAYYIQHGNTDYFDANCWSQVVHPHNSTLLMIPAFLFFGENATQMPQWFAYLAAVIAVGLICRELGACRLRCLEVSLFTALIPSWVMESCTAQNDMLMAALTASAVVFILRKESWFAMAALCVMLGLKSSALLPTAVIGIIFVTCVPMRMWAKAAAIGAACFVVFVLPSGYVSTARNFGHPFGPEDVRRSHAFVRIQDSIRYGPVNLVRYGVDFCTFDGLPPFWPFTVLQTALRSGVQTGIEKFGIDLMSAPTRPRDSFSFKKELCISEDGCFWGILGFALLWPLVFAGLFFQKYRLWSLCSLLFLLLQAFSSPYDPWRGRYFITGAVFVAPLLLLVLEGCLVCVRWYLLIMSVVAGLSASGAICLSRWPISFTWGGESFQSLFLRDRLGQMEGGSRRWEREFRAYERLVPPGSTVGLSVAPMSEYAFFGEHLDRIIVPLPDGKPCPPNIDYLIIDTRERTQPSDICLGRLWLRKRVK